MAKRLICGFLLISVLMTTLVFFTEVFEEQEEVADAAILKQGSTGEVVRTMQTRLRNWGYYSGGVDGIFGPKTEAAVRYFQRTNGLVVDGIVGPKTAAAIGIRLTQASPGGVSSSDAYLLARVVYGEARGEPYTGQVAVAAVILNRVRSSSFPNTIAGVVYQPWAFTVVQDGQINLTPDSTAKKAANDALNGWDPTYGCLFYYNPATATNAWIRSKEIRLTIGEHVFCV
ncbi:MAG: spore cortex-lytic enzyme [Clostridia bacterium]|nr:spore cortex-lytic enzyme [Clostridia bacterium]